MPDAFGATTPEEEDELLMRAYHQAQGAPVGQRYATFQSVAPPADQLAAQQVNQAYGPPPSLVPASAPSPAQQRVEQVFGPPPGSAAAAANMAQRAYGPQPAPGIAVPEVNVVPRPGLPGTMPGQGGAAPQPGAISSAQLHSQLRKDAGLGDEGTLIPHKVGLTVKPMLPGEQQQLNEAEDEGFRAQIEQGEAQIQSGQDIADRVVEQADEQDRIDARFAEREMERQSMLRDREARFGEMADQIANQPIETPSLWGDNTGEQILNRISVFLGAIGAAQGGPNYAYDRLQKDVERNIAARKEERGLKLGRLKDEQTMYEMARDRFKSEGAIDSVMRESAYRKVGAELERFKEFAKTPERRAALDALIAQNNAQLSALAIQRRQAMDADVLNERAIRARSAQQADTLKQQVQRRELEARGVKADREISGQTGEDAKGIRKANADYEASLAQINRYEQSNKDVGVTSDWRKKKDAENSWNQAVTTYQNEFLGKSENDRAVAEKSFPKGGTTTSKAAVESAAQAARQAARDKRDAAIKAAGGKPATFNPQGGQ